MKLGSKEDGGHGGHNGLRDIFEKAGSREISYECELALGILESKRDGESSWVLNKFHPTDKEYVDNAYDKFTSVLTYISKRFAEAQKSLHTK